MKSRGHLASRLSRLPLLAVIVFASITAAAGEDLKKAQELYDQARLRKQQGDITGAVTDTTAAIEQNHRFAEAYGYRASLYYELKQFDRAIADLNHAIEINPSNAVYFASRCQTYRHIGNLDAALGDCNRAIELSSRYAYSYAVRAQIKQSRGDTAGAAADFAKAQELDPTRYAAEMPQPTSPATPAAQPASDVDDDKAWAAGKYTMNLMRTLAIAVEAYATDHNYYPESKSMAELRALIQPTYVKSMPDRDGWGNAFRYYTSPNRQSYRFVSAGADGRFEHDWSFQGQPVVADEKATPSRTDDIVYEDGSFRRYPVASPRQVEASHAAQEAARLRDPAEATKLDIRSLATATEAWATDYDRYPSVKNVLELSKLLQPTYIAKAPLNDAWGTPYMYNISEDGKSYRFVSAGPNRRMELGSAASDDIVYINAAFTTAVAPENLQPWRTAAFIDSDLPPGATPQKGTTAATGELEKTAKEIVDWFKHDATIKDLDAVAKNLSEYAGKNYYVLVGPGLTQKKKAMLAYSWNGELFRSWLTTDQAERFAIKDRSVRYASQGNKANEIRRQIINIKDLSISDAAHLRVGDRIKGSVAVEGLESLSAKSTVRLTVRTANGTQIYYVAPNKQQRSGGSISFEAPAGLDLMDKEDARGPVMIFVDLLDEAPNRNSGPPHVISNTIMTVGFFEASR